MFCDSVISQRSSIVAICLLFSLSAGCGSEILEPVAMSGLTPVGYDAAGPDSSVATDDVKPDEVPPAKDLVKDWEKPDVTLFLTGRQHGYIEPCGCTGLTNQKGGLMRRHACQKILLDRGWDLVSIDAGNQVRRFGQQPVIKLQNTYNGLCKTMAYDSIGFGPDDLKLATIDLVQVMINSQERDNPFTCANLQIMDDDSMANLFRVIERNGQRIGVTSIIGDEFIKKFENHDELKLSSVKSALLQVVPRMKAQNCDLMVLTAQTSLENCRAIAKEFPVFDLLITAGGAGDPTNLPEPVKTGKHVTHMIQVGVKGMYVGLVGLYTKGPQKRIKYERVPLDHRFKDSPQMVKMFQDYQNQLKNIYVKNANEDIRPRVHPTGNKFVGSQACFECHDEEFDIWEDGTEGDGGPHVHATESIVHPPERGNIARNYDPECLSCHVTGWDPQNFFPYESGYIDLTKDKHLHANGCENCHGPGSRHVQLEQDDNNQSEMEKARLEMRLTLDQARKSACMKCHDLDNSPDFLVDGAFDKYWKKIEH